MTFNALGNAKASIIVILLLPLIYLLPHLVSNQAMGGLSCGAGGGCSGGIVYCNFIQLPIQESDEVVGGWPIKGFPYEGSEWLLWRTFCC